VVTYKLLRYINSVANALTHEITSIDQCLLLLGREKIYRWLSLLLFDLHNAGYAERILAEQALVRASLMERMGRQSNLADVSADHLFLTGLFSLLDKLLKQPLGEILAKVSLPPAVGTALLSGSGPYACFLEFAIACESGEGTEIQRCAQACGVDAATVNGEVLEALGWANQVGELGE
jgi:EAL and modified HD-GYP domain-containing signal transduction protein